ncbi:MAG: nuclear transport factor 2 family protein [Sphingomonadales bacterium]
MAQADARIQLAIDLFEAWSSGDPDAPEKYLSPDCVLEDIVGGTHRGWPDIRAFFANGLVRWPDLKLIPEKFWISEDGVALTWLMSATQRNDDFGREAVGKVWRSPGMSYLVISNGRVVHEVDYHDRVNVPLSLGVKP